MGKVFVGLVHYPIYNKQMDVISTSITNLDLHDIARTTTTYGVERYFIIHPEPVQQALAQEIMDYWQRGAGSQYNQDRCTAFAHMMIQPSIEQAKQSIVNQYGGDVVTVVTDARVYPNSIDYSSLRLKIVNDEQHYLILFGTGWGMTAEVMNQMDYRLMPIMGKGDYNHLSVRAAAAIILDRLLG